MSAPLTVRTLLVEDSRGTRAHVERVLSEVAEARFETESADDLASALVRVASGGIDLVLLDLHLPDSQGLETLARLRARFADLPVIVLTSQGAATLGLDALKMGAQDFFEKEKLASHWVGRAIRYALERHQLMEVALRHARELQAAETNLSNLIHGNPDGMVLLNGHGRIALVNPAAEAILGAEARELLGKGLGFEVRAGDSSTVEVSGGPGESMGVQLRAVSIEWDGAPHLLVTMRTR